jgi:hypothetical protein
MLRRWVNALPWLPAATLEPLSQLLLVCLYDYDIRCGAHAPHEPARTPRLVACQPVCSAKPRSLCLPCAPVAVSAVGRLPTQTMHSVDKHCPMPPRTTRSSLPYLLTAPPFPTTTFTRVAPNPAAQLPDGRGRHGGLPAAARGHRHGVAAGRPGRASSRPDHRGRRRGHKRRRRRCAAQPPRRAGSCSCSSAGAGRGGRGGRGNGGGGGGGRRRGRGRRWGAAGGHGAAAAPRAHGRPGPADDAGTAVWTTPYDAVYGRVAAVLPSTAATLSLGAPRNTS